MISDVLGDPLSIIGSGPTVEDTSTPEAALALLERFGARRARIAPRVFDYLEHKAAEALPQHPLAAVRCEVTNRVIGNNATAADAAGLAAVALGYSPAVCCAPRSEGPAEQIGRHLAEMALDMRSGTPDCLVSGGEPVVTLVDASRRGRGGRNQQLVLAALERLWDESIDDLVLLSAGTDGEDGPTDAAGALLDGAVLAEARRIGLAPAGFLARNDAYHFFEPLGALLKTGPTHTNVCDLRVVLVRRESRQS
jgi:hydroxypyruvate reductase